MSNADSQNSSPNTSNTNRSLKGRGANIAPTGRFESVTIEQDWSDLDDDEIVGLNSKKVVTEFLLDRSESIVSENNSPDLNFRYSLNPYRGCEHGCSYCYARPSHEYLGFSSGLDFETKIVVKPDAAKLFRKWLRRPSYEVDVISFSGVTDCYQPAERHFRLTRDCLEVALEASQPVSVITKNSLVTRDLDLLKPLAERKLFRAAISITTLDKKLANQMEPRTSTPAARLKTIRQLADHDIPVFAMVAPIIPGLNDHEIPSILEAVADAGARGASFVMLRLPFNLKMIFSEWLERFYPDRADKILGRLRSVRDGQLNRSRFGERMRGTGEMASQIKSTFRLFQQKYGLDEQPEPLDVDRFHAPEADSRQKRLF